jgi:hypothetical protein
MMTVTQVGCMPETTAITRREFRGYVEATTIEASTTAKRHLPHAKRQNTINPISGSGLPPQAQFYLTQINTAIYVIDLINIGSNLNGTCQDLRSGANNTQGAAIAINITQAADFVCAAYAANLTYIEPSLVQIFAAALYAVEVAGNFTGTTNTTALCSSIDVDILTLPVFGVDGQGVQSYVCNAYNASLATTFSTGTSSITSTASADTIGPTSWGNRTSFGTSPIVTGASTGTGVSGWPFGNYTGTRTRSYTGPRTKSSGGTRTKPGSGYTQPAGTGLSQSGLPGSTAQSGSGYDQSTATGFDQPTATDGPGSPYSSDTASSGETGSDYNQPTGADVSGWSYGSLIGFPTESGSGYAQPTGTAVSGWPYGNLTGFPTGPGSGYAQPTGTRASDYPFGIQFSSLETPSSARLPPNPSTLHYYPAVSPSASPIVFYGYGYHG